MNSLPNTSIPHFDFNLAQNFNPRALPKLLISVFPIGGESFFFGNMYPILEKLKAGGVKLLWHKAYNALDGLTGYTILEGAPESVIQIAEYWGFTFEHYSSFDPYEFAPVQPAAPGAQDTAVPNSFAAQGASSSAAGPSSSNS